MRSTLRNAAHEAALDEFGFVVVPFLDSELIAALSAAHDELGEAPDDPQIALYFGFHSADRDYKWTVHHRLRAILDDRAAETFADHDTYLAIFITKWPGPHSAFAPHQDPTLVDERSYRGVTIWAPLVPTGYDAEGRDNGMLHVVPGSHRFTEGGRVRDVSRSQLTGLDTSTIERHAVGVPTQPGEAIVFDDRLVHFSYPNDTDTPRVVVSLGVRPSEAPCVLVRDDTDAMTMYAVDDASFIDVTASAQHLWTPDSAPIATLPPPAKPLSDDEFSRLAATVTPPPGTVPARRSRSLDPGLFCAFCGSADVDVTDRDGQENSQLTCADCRPKREASALPSAASASSHARPLRSYWDARNRPTGRRWPIDPVLRDTRVDRRLRRDGFATVPALAAADAARLRAWYLGRWDSGAGFQADLNVDNPPYRREVRALCAPIAAPLVEATFRDHEPFLFNFLCKWPGQDSDLYLHQDWMYIDERSGQATFVMWIPLQDVTSHNGQLQVLRGSQRVDRALRGTDLTGPWVDDEHTIRPRLESLPVPLGQAALMNNALVHCSFPNNTDEPRVVLAVGVRPRGAQPVYFRSDGPGRAARYDIDDDFLCQYTPAQLAGSAPPIPVAESIAVEPLECSAQELADTLDRVGRVWP